MTTLTASPGPLAGPDASVFEYSVPDDGIGRRLHFKRQSTPDFENPMDANRDNVYEVLVRVTDSKGAATGEQVRQGNGQQRGRDG